MWCPYWHLQYFEKPHVKIYSKWFSESCNANEHQGTLSTAGESSFFFSLPIRKKLRISVGHMSHKSRSAWSICQTRKAVGGIPIDSWGTQIWLREWIGVNLYGGIRLFSFFFKPLVHFLTSDYFRLLSQAYSCLYDDSLQKLRT